MTAAPLSIVAIKISWPGQSTNDTWRTSDRRPPHPSGQMGASSFDDPYDMYRSGRGYSTIMFSVHATQMALFAARLTQPFLHS